MPVEDPLFRRVIPLHASWLKTCEAVGFVRTVAPERAIGIHDVQINERVLTGLTYWLSEYGGTNYRWLAPGPTA